MLALALALTLAQPYPNDQPPPLWSHAYAAGLSGGDGFTVAKALLFPTVRGYTTPEQYCISGRSGHRCLACGFGLLDGGCQLQCAREDGGVEGVVNDPGGTCHPVNGIANARTREVTTSDFPVFYDDGGVSDWFERDGGMITIWGFSRGGPGGLDYWLDDNNDTGHFSFRENGGVMEWFQGSNIAPLDGLNTFTAINRDALGIWTLRYTGGVDVGGGATAIYVMNFNAGSNVYGKDNGITPVGSDCGSPWYFGSRRAADFSVGGPMGGVTWWEGKVTNDEQTEVAQAFWSVPITDAGYRWVSGLSYPTGIDNTSRSGNVDFANSLGFLVSPEGIEGVDALGTNWWAANATAFNSMPKTGTSCTVTAGVSRGAIAEHLNAAECDRISNFDPSGYCYVWSLDAGVPGTTLWWDASSFAKASDGGVTHDAFRLRMQSDGTWTGGGHTFDCDFSDAGYNNTRRECRSKLTGGSYAIAAVGVPPNGTIDACQAQWTNSPALEPVVLDTTLRTSGAQYHANIPPDWPQPDAGPGRIVLVSQMPYDPGSDWTTATDVIYPLDLDQRGTYGLVDHVVVMAYGYTTTGLELITHRDGTTLCGGGTCDFQVNGISFPSGDTVATAYEWDSSTAGGTKATSRAKQADCGPMPRGMTPAAANVFAASCALSAKAVIATDNNPDSGVIAPFGHVTVTGRNASTIVSTNKVQAVELLTKP